MTDTFQTNSLPKLLKCNIIIKSSKSQTYDERKLLMLVLGNIDSEEIKRKFMEKFEEQRDDASEYEIGTMKGERLETWVKHKPCGKRFQTRPYLFLQEKWPKTCPYCYPYEKPEYTEKDMRYRVTKASKGNIKLVEPIEKFNGPQLVRYTKLECRNCGHVWTRTFRGIQDTLRCPNCKLPEKE